MGWLLPLSPLYELKLRRNLLSEAAEIRHDRDMAVPKFWSNTYDGNGSPLFTRRLLVLLHVYLLLLMHMGTPHGDDRAISLGEKIMFRASFPHENVSDDSTMLWNGRWISGRFASRSATRPHSSRGINHRRSAHS